MKYKPGDKVKVRSDLKAGEDYGNDDWANGMDKYLGRVVTIEGIVDGCDKYKIQGESRWTFTDEMFEGLAHIKAYDLMKAAAENPQEYEGRRYRVWDGSGLWEPGKSKRHDECIIRSGRIKSFEGDYYVAIFSDTLLEEIPPEPKPVGFIEAVMAFAEGKTIKCEWIYGTRVYRPTCENSNLVDDHKAAITPDEILEGEWYILD